MCSIEDSLSRQVSRQCCEAIETLFENDIVGEVSLEVGRSSAIIKVRDTIISLFFAYFTGSSTHC